MFKIFAKSEEKLAKSVVLYPDEDGILCVDEDATKPISKDELINLFKKGMVLIYASSTSFRKPSELVIDDDYAQVNVIAKVSDSVAEVNYYSDGYSAE